MHQSYDQYGIPGNTGNGILDTESQSHDLTILINYSNYLHATDITDIKHLDASFIQIFNVKLLDIL